jgi:hypothetical protein
LRLMFTMQVMSEVPSKPCVESDFDLSR